MAPRPTDAGPIASSKPSMDARVKALRASRCDLRKAIVDGGFEIHYQPLVNLRNNAVTGCEALLRWRHAKLGHDLAGAIHPGR